MTFNFSTRSENNLRGVHPDLIRIARRALALTPIDFAITEGLRTLARQKQLVAEGKSQTLHSRHLTGHAIDVLVLPVPTGSWDWKYYQQLSTVFKQAGALLNIPIEWGGDWKTLKDGPHFQLPRSAYPEDK
ncbi:M15 family metallopeptidase [Atlantibacter subterraneus]|uniref:M15 family metallopeptidase n=1 Tax=Atlantibacter subterraneus TaxID=255519 RepID=UPI00296422ED|nr:M15 family metallopeptidase [Atlantibacter subterranea]MDW2744569.1 M15 family metallopeptidase [Atlantibacter subterranea]